MARVSDDHLLHHLVVPPSGDRIDVSVSVSVYTYTMLHSDG